METTIFEIKFIDGRIYRVHCENRSQSGKMVSWYHANKDRGVFLSFTPILSGIHSTKQFLEIIKN